MKPYLYVLSAAFLFFTLPVLASEADLKVQIERLRAQQELQNQKIEQLEKDSQKPIASGSPDNTIGGYGEIIYNHNLRDNSKNQMDLRRFVLFFGHRFSDQLTFNSEVEWEHAVTSATDKGEAEIEQAYLNYQFSPTFNLKTGLILMPFGFLNQNHEPPVFYGVERNEVETRIIPSTWREGGIGLSGKTHFGLGWELGAVTGFDVAKLDDASAPLSASHQELQLAKSHDISYYGALNYQRPGLILGSSLFTGNSTQGNADFNANNKLPDLGGLTGRVTLWDLHARWQKNAWDISAVYAKGTWGDAEAIDQAIDKFNTLQNTERAFIPSEFYGWLAQAAYTFGLSGEATISPFVRYEEYDTQAKMPTGFVAQRENADQVVTAGVSFKPMLQVVFKADVQKFIAHADNNRFNFGMGYMF